MDVILSVLFGLFIVKVYSVPPDICFEKFKWQDCGMIPKAVIYYYAPGSRCEVGLWRGCTPNPNMFADEYECVQTCIFSLRARPEDFHNLNKEVFIESEETTTEAMKVSDGGETTATDGTSETGTDEGATTGDGDAPTTVGEIEGAAEGKTEAEAPAEAEAEAAAPVEGEAKEAPAEGA